MVDINQRPKLVGQYIRQKREARSLSQRALGQLFDPPVTTQFISNLERGVTPLPPNHIPTLSRVLAINETELVGLLEKEYAMKLTGRAGLNGLNGLNGSNGSVQITLQVQPNDLPFMRLLYDAFRTADVKTQQSFMNLCESMLNLPKSSSGNYDKKSEQ